MERMKAVLLLVEPLLVFLKRERPRKRAPLPELLLQILLLLCLEIHHEGSLQAHPSLLVLEFRLHYLAKDRKIK
jgi:hypothetical protein